MPDIDDCPGKRRLGASPDPTYIKTMRRATRLLLTVTILVSGAAFTLDAGRARAQDIQFFRIGTGSTAGTYYPVGALIANAVSNPPGSRACKAGGSCGVPGLIAAAVATQGSVANIEAVASGRLESGLAQSDTINAALHGTGRFAARGAKANIRVVANLFPESLHLVVRKAAGIRGIAGLRGRRVSLDTPGSGTRAIAELVLGAFGIAGTSLAAWEVTPGRAVDLMLGDELDAFFLVAGYPTQAVAELARGGRVDLLSVAEPPVLRLLESHPYLALDTIPAGTYPGVDAVSTIGVGAQWVVRAELDDELVYRLTKALWHPNNRGVLDSGHAKARLIRIETALSGVSVPLHSGAERYYREVGLLAPVPPPPKRRPPR